jgi:pSer/pThr/pTyr-binding forkhead associated (FHA) protein
MALGLSSFARRLLSDEAGTRAAQTVPLLVWESPLHSTGEPSKQNAFSMGITVGRTENNDIIVDENSISRFHAYFQQDARTLDWMLVDAESKNGTWVGALKLVPKQGALVTDQTRVRFGEIEMVFLTPASFFSYLQRLMGG